MLLKAELLKNNFNLIRLIAAMQVAVIHSCNHFGYDSLAIKVLKLFPGVPLFFFISGFLIGNTYIKNYEKGLTYFFRNRVLRLYPALILCVLIATASVFVVGYLKPASVEPGHLLAWVLAQSTVGQVYNPDFMRGYGVGVLNGSLWTITVEVQFYLLMPVLFWLFRKMKAVFWILFVCSIVFNIYIRFYPGWESIYMKLFSVSFLPWVYMFMLGFLFTYYPSWQQYVQKFNAWLIGGLYVASMFLIGNYETNSMNSINPVSVFILGLLVIRISRASIRLPGRVAKFIDNNDISYGVYIYHMPVINALLFFNTLPAFVNILIGIFLSVALSYISWRLIEKPALKLKHKPVPSVVKIY